MTMISYAQNFEDVMLWRALGNIPNGLYIDIGAQDPLVDSVSKAFYDKGWRGIHVEATPTYAEKLRLDRPDEIVIQAAVNDVTGSIVLHEIPGGGLSTGDLDTAHAHIERGFNVQAVTVPCITLEEVFSRASSKEVHWLKIDVEGMEHQVLRSWGSCDVLPWIVVVESTLPLTTIESHAIWEHCLLERGYRHVYFDGLNRYYVSPNHQELTAAFESAPNVFDDFALAGNASAPFCLHINENHRRAEDTMREQIAQSQREQALAKQASDKALAQAQNQLRDSRETIQTIESKLLHQNAVYLDLERTLRSETQAALILLSQTQQAAAKRELFLQNKADATLLQIKADLKSSLQKLANTENDHGKKLAALQAQIQTIQSEAVKKEQDFKGLLTVVRQQAELDKQDFSNNLSRREEAFTQQLLAANANAEANLTQQAQANVAQLAGMRNKLDAAVAAIAATQRSNDLAQDRIKELVRNEQTLAQHILDVHAQSATTIDQLSATHALQFSQLQARHTDEIKAERQNTVLQTQLLNSVQQSLDAVHASLTWRITAPLRKLTSHGSPDKPDADSLANMSQQPRQSTLSVDESTAVIPSKPEPTVRNMTSQKFTTQTGSLVKAKTLDNLMAWNGQEFVNAAYYTLLNRSPDPEGLQYYVRRLRSGFAKIGVLKQMQQSAEGKVNAVTLNGLDAAIKRYTRGQSLVFGWIFRWLEGGEGDSPTERKLRVIQNQLIDFREDSSEKLRGLENQLIELRNESSRRSVNINANVIKVLEKIQSQDTSATSDVTPKQSAVLKPAAPAPHTVSIVDTPIIFEAVSPVEVIAQLKAVVMQSKEALLLSLNTRDTRIQYTQSQGK
jgi:FkbM family methyltransferase